MDVIKLENFGFMLDGLATRMELMAEELEFDGFFSTVAAGSNALR